MGTLAMALSLCNQWEYARRGQWSMYRLASLGPGTSWAASLGKALTIIASVTYGHTGALLPKKSDHSELLRKKKRKSKSFRDKFSLCRPG